MLNQIVYENLLVTSLYVSENVKLFHLIVNVHAAAVNVHRADAASCDHVDVDNALGWCLGCMTCTAVTV